MCCTKSGIAAPTNAPWETIVEQVGLSARITLAPAEGNAWEPRRRLEVKLTSALDGQPVRAEVPAVWIDAGRMGFNGERECANRIGRYAQSSSLRPQALLDLNSYNVLTLNRDASLSILDPGVQLAGVTSLRAVVRLPGVGVDWVAASGDPRVFVSVPSRRSVAVADLEKRAVTEEVMLPGAPGRLAMHPTRREAWVGIPEFDTKPGQSERAGGVAIIDANAPEGARTVKLGRGHVEMAFDPAGWVAVVQRHEPAVVLIDPTTLQVAARVDLPPDSLPLSVSFDAVQGRFLVTDARVGRLLSIDRRGEGSRDLSLQPGVGPMAISPDGRWLFVTNPGAGVVDIVELAPWRHAHRTSITGRPYAVAFTDRYAYVRLLDSPNVALIALSSLTATPTLQSIQMGERAPASVGDLPIAQTMTPATGGNGMFVASPGDNSVYFFMEGMNAPSGSVSAKGYDIRAVRLSQGGMHEITPGVFAAEVTLPENQELLVAVASRSPRAQFCVQLPRLPGFGAARAPVTLNWDVLPEHDDYLQVTLNGGDERQRPEHLRIVLFQWPHRRIEVLVPSVEPGRYRTRLSDLPKGRWFAHPDVPEEPKLASRYRSFQRKARSDP